MFINVGIPGIIGLVLLLWPQSIFIGSKAIPDLKDIWLLRSMGVVLMFVAVVNVVNDFASV